MVSEGQQRLVRRAARAVGRNGLAHAYGHCSLRLDTKHFLVCASKPMGQIPAGEAGTLVPVDGALPEGVLGEVRIHQAIYRARPDVNGIVRSMPPATMALSTLRLTPMPRHGLGSYFFPAVALWDDAQLIREDDAAQILADNLGQGCAIAMRGNGLVVCADSLEKAVVLSWYAEDAARLELNVLAVRGVGDAAVMEALECESRATWRGRIMERMWDYLAYGDPEGE